MSRTVRRFAAYLLICVGVDAGISPAPLLRYVVVGTLICAGLAALP